MGRNNDIKNIQSEIQSVYDDILSSLDSTNSLFSNQSLRMNINEESELKINFDSREQENAFSIVDINLKQPQFYFKNITSQVNLNHIKEKSIKTKSVTPLRTKDYDMSEFQQNSIANQANNIKLTNNIKVNFDIPEKKSTALDNYSSKTVNEGINYDNTNKVSNNNSLNSSVLNAGVKKTDLNKFLNFNK